MTYSCRTYDSTSSRTLRTQRRKSSPGGGQFFQQRRGAVAVVAGGVGEGREPVANVPKPYAVGIMHRPAAIDREAVPLHPDHLHIARPLCYPPLPEARPLVHPPD